MSYSNEQERATGTFHKTREEGQKLIKEVDNGKEKLERNYFGDMSIKMDIVLEEMVKEEIKT